MRPLPRIHAFTDPSLLSHPELGIRAAAIAAAGPAVALHVRARGLTAALLTAAAGRLLALARPPEASVLVSGRSDIAAAVGAHGVQLARQDLMASDARRVLPHGWIGCSVHNRNEAEAAVQEGADFLTVGNVYETDTHPGRPAAGLEVVREAAMLGLPVIAIGGITPERAAAVRAAGAYGVAAIRALWYAPDPAAATVAMLEPWL
ncbi:MAG TPA: thiamine phosphate synthase, partial [Gemmatimonadales bacterium]|nr:thiamine phosphate synthase [Gemmatimonadales bacterium]